MFKKLLSAILGCFFSLMLPFAVLGLCSGWCVDPGMGVPQELADQVNSMYGGAGLNSSNTSDLGAALEAIHNEYFLSHGIGIEYDDGTYVAPYGQQSSGGTSSQSTKQSSSTDSSASSTKKEEKTETRTETKPEGPEEEPVEEHVHDYVKEVTKEPTCTEAGTATFTCECGDSYTEEVPALGHDEGEWEVETESTCTAEGKKVLKCTRDGEVLDEEAIPVREHTPGEWEVTKAANWISDGEQVKKCTVCGEVLETQAIPANHTPLYIIGGILLVLILATVIIVRKKKR